MFYWVDTIPRFGYVDGVIWVPVPTGLAIIVVSYLGLMLMYTIVDYGLSVLRGVLGGLIH